MSKLQEHFIACQQTGTAHNTQTINVVARNRRSLLESVATARIMPSKNSAWWHTATAA
jgi:hypothetical protein